MINIEKMNRANQAEKLLQIKESLAYSKELIPLALNSDFGYRFQVEIGNTISDRLICVTAFDVNLGGNSTMTIYSFDSKEHKSKKVKIIKEMFMGKLKLSDFSDMKIY